jgi:hypothetical protein
LSWGGFPQAVAAQMYGDDPAPLVQALFDVVQRDVFGAASLTETQVTALLATEAGPAGSWAVPASFLAYSLDV